MCIVFPCAFKYSDREARYSVSSMTRSLRVLMFPWEGKASSPETWPKHGNTTRLPKLAVSWMSHGFPHAWVPRPSLRRWSRCPQLWWEDSPEDEEKIRGILRKPWILHEFYEFDQQKKHWTKYTEFAKCFFCRFFLAFSTFLKVSALCHRGLGCRFHLYG